MTETDSEIKQVYLSYPRHVGPEAALKAIQKELSLRKLKDISTDKLVELQLKIYEVLKEEYTEARPLSSWEIEALK